MTTQQIEVLQWWYGKRDYLTGAMLYGRYGKNKVLQTNFLKEGKERFLSGKLEYELCKAVGLNFKKMPLLPDGMLPETINVFNRPNVIIPDVETYPGANLPDTGKRIPILSDVKLMQYPKVIRRLKMEYQENYTDRSILHRKMKAVPEANTPGNMQTRADYLAEIKRTSAHMDYLYAFIAEYEKNKVVPTEETVWPPKKEENLPGDINGLKRVKQNLQTSNTKDNNWLLYQQKTKAKKEDPMPEGPRRKKIEFRIKKRNETIEIINGKLVELEK